MPITVNAIIYKYSNYHKRMVVTAADETEAMKFLTKQAAEINENEFVPDSTDFKVRILKIVEEQDTKYIEE
jgi:hypothetical protein